MATGCAGLVDFNTLSASDCALSAITDVAVVLDDRKLEDRGLVEVGDSSWEVLAEIVYTAAVLGTESGRCGDRSGSLGIGGTFAVWLNPFIASAAIELVLADFLCTMKVGLMKDVVLVVPPSPFLSMQRLESSL